MFNEILKNKELTIKDLSVGADVPRSTIADLASGKTSIERMSAGNLYKISCFLDISMQDLYEYCRLPEVGDLSLFIETENDKIVNDGLKVYIQALAKNNLVETTYALEDHIRFQKYMSAVRDFYKYRRLEMPARYVDYVAYLED